MKVLVISPNFFAQTVWTLGLCISKLYASHETRFFGPGYDNHNPSLTHVQDILSYTIPDADIVCFHQPQHFSHIKGLENLKIPTIVHVGEYGFNHFEWIPDWIDEKKFSLMVSDFKSNTDAHESRGRTPTLWHVWGADTEVLQDEGIDRDIDVTALFSVRHYTEGLGSISSQYPRRSDSIRQVENSGVRAFTRGICAEDQNIITGEAYTKLLNRSRIAVDSPDRSRNIHQRWFEYPACGALLLAYVPGRDEHNILGFKHLDNCVFYDPFEEGGLTRTIKVLMRQPDMVKAIANDGNRFVRDKFNLEKTTKRFWRKVEGIL